MKARNSFVVRYKEERVNWKKQKQDSENFNQSFSLFNKKLFMDDILSMDFMKR